MIKRVLAIFVVAGLGFSATACGDDDDDGGGSGLNAQTCQQGCAKSAAAMCEQDDPETCEQECNDSAALVPAACQDEANTYGSCAAKATWECNDGFAEPVGCDITPMLACIFANSGAGGGG